MLWAILHYFVPVIQSGAKITITSATAGAQIFYTTDGSEPNENSKLYTTPVEISDNTRISAIAHKNGYLASYVKTENFLYVDPKINGLRYAVYEGEWEDQPEIGKLKAVSTGKQFDFNVGRITKRDDYIAIVFEGLIQIQKPGIYRFYSSANDGSWLYVNDKLVVDNSSIGNKQFGEIRLNKGKIPLKVIYYENSGTESLSVEIKMPGRERQKIPASMLFLE